jgi:hypothetical protein
MTEATVLPAPTAANVLRCFRAGNAAHVLFGRGWYARARDEALSLDPTDPVRGAAVLAVLSPMCSWDRNVTLARQAYALAGEGASHDEIVAALGCLKRNASKAAAIILGADPAQVVSGEKVTAFWGRIVDAAQGSTGPSSVVVDRHAYDIAVGVVTDDRTRSVALGRKGGFHAVQMCYVRAASVLRRTGECPGVTPAELQAITWVAWRELFAHSQGKAAARRDVTALAA